MAEKALKKNKAHVVYKNAAGKRVPGVTTICGIMDKPALVSWANRMGLEGIDTRSYVDSLAGAGTLAHYLVECDFRNVDPDPDVLREYAPADMDRAENSLLSYYEWRKVHVVTPIANEIQLVSEKLQVGGTCDIYAEVDTTKTLIDIKTCKALYGTTDEKWTQVAGYYLIMEENGYHVDEVYILRIGRDESEGFEYVPIPDLSLHIKRFKTCRELYDINSQLRRVKV